jgi:hypothetical protein
VSPRPELVVQTLPPELRLDKGIHPPPNGGFQACVMEAVAYVAGESWSDQPECACPVIGAFLRCWNDAMDDGDRQMLVPLIPRLVGTRSTPEVEEKRAWMATDWLVRECAPAWLRLAGLDDHAKALEQLAPVASSSLARAAHPSIAAARAAAGDAAWDAAGDAAWDAAGDAAWAAWDAAGDAAWAAAGAAWDAAWAAAGDAAWDAAGDAAGAAALDAARAAAGAAARDAVRPTVKALQQSALALVDRMIEVEA